MYLSLQVYSGMPRILYSGIPVSHDEIPHAQQFTQNCSGHYVRISPFQHPMPPPFPFFLASSPPAAPPSSSLTQALVDQYAPMSRRQLSFQTPAAPVDSCWKEQQQRQRQHHPPTLLPPPPVSAAPVSGGAITQWPSPTSLSPATLATLLGPGDGMSTSKLDELPSFFFGQVLDEADNHRGGSDGETHRIRCALATPPPLQQEHREDIEAEHHTRDAANHHRYQHNAVSCDTFYSESSPEQIAADAAAAAAAAAASDVRVQVFPALLLPESPFIPISGNLADLEETRNQPHYLPRVSVGDDQIHGKTAADDESRDVDCDPLEGVDLEQLFQHFDGTDQMCKGPDGSAGRVSSGDISTGATVKIEKEAALKGAEKRGERVASAEDTTTIQQYGGECTQNIDLQSLFQSFVDDLEALPPLDLTAIGKPIGDAVNTAAFVVPPAHCSHYAHKEETPMSPVQQSKKRRFSEEECSYNPHTPEKMNFTSGALGLVQRRCNPRQQQQQQQQQQSEGRKNHRAPERKTYSTTAPPKLKFGTGSRLHIMHQTFDAAASSVIRSEIVVMLPAPAKRCRVTKSQTKKKDDGDETDEEEEFSTSPSSYVPTRCVYLFGKTITASDAGRLARIVLPRAAVEQYLPRCDNKNGIPLTLWDVHGNTFSVILKYWMNGRPVAKRMWLLDQCQEVIAALGLEQGKLLDFYQADDRRLVVNAS